jgi:hypothetical protein
MIRVGGRLRKSILAMISLIGLNWTNTNGLNLMMNKGLISKSLLISKGELFPLFYSLIHPKTFSLP